ncbi:MAG: flp pilus assembly protein (TadG-like), partial [Moraxellaceae bacterium]|nr:flp pilus assembly protein (TadG-like) [Moraxellaceae bacterium]
MSANDCPSACPAGRPATWRFPASRGTSRRQPVLQPGAPRRRQRGAALVEFAIGFTLFLLVVFGTMELALTYFAWNRVSEAARDGSRHLIVNAPLADLSAQDCAAATPGAVTVACSSGSCATLMARLQNQAPFVAPAHVSVEYSCSGAGNPAAPAENRVRTVSLRISGVPHAQAIPLLGALGWDNPST